MDFLFFDDVRKKSLLIPALILVSSILFLLINVYGLRLGITNVLPHLFYIPIILTAYYYPRRGVVFASVLAFCYCALSLTAATLAMPDILSAIARSGVFILIAAVVSFLSGRMHQDARMCRRLVSVVNSSGDAITGENIDGIITDWNYGAEQLYGYLSDEIIGTPTSVIIPPGRLAEKQQMLEKIRQGETVERVETERIRKDGTLVQISLSLSPILSSVGEITGVSTIAHDITKRKRAEAALGESEKKYRSIFNSFPDVYYQTDLNGIITTLSPSVKRSGWEPEELIGHPVTEQYPFPEQRAGLLERLQHDGEVKGYEITLRGRDGRDIQTSVSSHLIYDDSGKPTGVEGTIRNINEKKKMEIALQESEAKFREIFNAANDAIQLHEVGKRGLPGKIIDVNDVACRMLQYSKEELLGKNPLDLVTGYHSPHLEDLGGEIKTRGSAIFETEHRRKDGGIVPVEVSVRVVTIQGRRMGLAIIRDLTERKRGEAAFRRLSADHRAIIEHAPAMIWYKDTKNTFVRVNPAGARAFSMTIDEIEGKSAYDLFPDLADKYYQDDLDVINSGIPKMGIIEPMITADGKHLWVQTDKIPIKDEQGTVTGILLFVVDISDRKRADDNLRMLNKKLSLLSGITRHDIRNQLMALNAYIELSTDAIDNPAELREFFAKELKITEVLAEQISFTKDYEDIGAKSPVWQDVSALVSIAGAALPLGNIRLEIACPGLEVCADPLLEKVFYNLIDNSLHYGGNAMTAIRVTTVEQGPALRIIVEDDGTGISMEDKKYLFTKGFGRNTGLGLFLSREILLITGITITETGIPGTGARFEITVPEKGYRFPGTP